MGKCAVHLMVRMIAFLKSNGIHSGMTGLLSEINIKLSFLLLFFICFFMLLAALKLLVDTFLELSLLFFSKDKMGRRPAKAKRGFYHFSDRRTCVHVMLSFHLVQSAGIDFLNQNLSR